MEVLQVSSYISEEKSVIASCYFGPQANETSKLEVDVELESSAVDVLIKIIVENLKKHIEKVYATVSVYKSYCGLSFFG